MSATKRKIDARRIAKAIADDLFQSGSGQADRLVLTSADGRDMGGWARGPAIDRIVMVLLDQLEPAK